MGSVGRNESNSHQLARIGEKRVFGDLDIHHVQKVGINRFWAREAEVGINRFWARESNSHQLARIGERKLFHELDVHHV